MGIFKKLKNKISIRNSTKGFYFGHTEAEGENMQGASLLDYFDDYLCILDQLQTGKYIFTGRKGVGKSAIAKFIKDKSDQENESYAKLLRISDYNIEKHIQTKEAEENKEKLIFEWLILVNMVRLIVSNQCGKYTTEYDKLRKFLNINSGVVNVDAYEISHIERNKGGEVSFGGLKHVFGGILKYYFKINVNKAPFYKLIPPLKEILKIILDYPVNKNLEFWLLFDDLDINFNVKNVEDNNKVIELLRIAKEYNNEIFNKNNAKILVFIRDDIRDNLMSKYPDSAKIFSSYEIFIDWFNHYSPSQDESEIPLKQLVNRRIELNFSNREIEFVGDPWDYLFERDIVPNKSSFKYILDFTFYRPRDIITFLSTMSNENYTYPLDFYSIKVLLKAYIKINVAEIKSELKLFFSDEEIEFIFNEFFPYIMNNPNASETELCTKLESTITSLISKRALELLRNYSLIIMKDSKENLYFSYRNSINVNPQNTGPLYFTLHKCIYHYYKYIN